MKWAVFLTQSNLSSALGGVKLSTIYSADVCSPLSHCAFNNNRRASEHQGVVLKPLAGVIFERASLFFPGAEWGMTVLGSV